VPRLAEAILTVPEAAYVAGVTERTINHEIDKRILRSRGRKERRAVRGPDLLYLGAVRAVRKHMAPQLRRQLRKAIESAVAEARPVARIAAFEVEIAALEREILANLTALERMQREHIESRPRVLGGEPVVKGTRIPARLVADLVKRGVSRTEIRSEYDLLPEQIEAAVIFARVKPKRGRPAIRKLHVKKHVLADR
jgi:uncharacterized protein (DUF433 family)